MKTIEDIAEDAYPVFKGDHLKSRKREIQRRAFIRGAKVILGEIEKLFAVDKETVDDIRSYIKQLKGDGIRGESETIL